MLRYIVIIIGIVMIAITGIVILKLMVSKPETEEIRLSIEQYTTLQDRQFTIERMRQLKLIIREIMLMLGEIILPILGCVAIGFILLGIKKRFAPTMTHSQPDPVDRSRVVTTIIPILPETVDERIYIAQAAPLAALALAKGEVTEQTIQMMRANASVLKAMRGSGKNAEQAALTDGDNEETEQQTAEKTLSQLIEDGDFAPGRPIMVGYYEGQPEFRDADSFRVLGVVGESGSGKTLTSAIFIGEMIGNANYVVKLCDPHARHPQSLTTRLRKFIEFGFVEEINPFYVHQSIAELDAILNRRLNREEPSDPGILFVLEEFNQITLRADPGHLKVIIDFLTRCTTETRKANIMFVGLAGSWHARFFGNKADIRRAINTAYVHHCHPDTAAMLLKDRDDLKQMKALNRKRRALFAGSFADTKLLTIPHCQDADFDRWATMIQDHRRSHGGPIQIPTPPPTITGQGELSRQLRDSRIWGEPEQARLALFPQMNENTFRARWYGSRPWSDQEAEKIRQVLASQSTGGADRAALEGIENQETP